MWDNELGVLLVSYGRFRYLNPTIIGAGVVIAKETAIAKKLLLLLL